MRKPVYSTEAEPRVFDSVKGTGAESTTLRLRALGMEGRGGGWGGVGWGGVVGGWVRAGRWEVREISDFRWFKNFDGFDFLAPIDWV